MPRSWGRGFIGASTGVGVGNGVRGGMGALVGHVSTMAFPLSDRRSLGRS